jgi:hypothetical protein
LTESALLISAGERLSRETALSSWFDPTFSIGGGGIGRKLSPETRRGF